MEVHRAETLQLPASLLTIGALDGIHLGHQALINHARKRAERFNVPLVVYTFDPPPKVYFQHSKLLTPLPEKLKRLEKMGVEHVVIASFDAKFLSKGTDAFIKEIKCLNPVEIWEGSDFRFGRNRDGDIHLLRKHFSVGIFEPVRCNAGEIISSTRIRKLLSNDSMEKAEQLLGWPIRKCDSLLSLD
ncbi:FAD synthetase family protein [Bacillus piscicola]|uniref:FAD synthetase family protein n=1 Tax=Bacillus piscicola TaxID=1632684 RepID=UPI001F09B13D|nr:FAD synthetase family protein [Bacillus piscicola]